MGGIGAGGAAGFTRAEEDDRSGGVGVAGTSGTPAFTGVPGPEKGRGRGAGGVTVGLLLVDTGKEGVNAGGLKGGAALTGGGGIGRGRGAAAVTDGASLMGPGIEGDMGGGGMTDGVAGTGDAATAGSSTGAGDFAPEAERRGGGGAGGITKAAGWGGATAGGGSVLAVITGKGGGGGLAAGMGGGGNFAAGEARGSWIWTGSSGDVSD
jgi:hypothetical protein